MTEEQRIALAKTNQEETATAHRLAADQRARDIAEGRGEPLVQSLADSIKGKLEREEFQGTPATETA